MAVRLIAMDMDGTLLDSRQKLTAANVEALKQAQEKGYAEADPTADVSGADAARKICILASLAFNTHIALENVSVMQGIEDVTEEDVIKAEKRGYAVKLIGFGEKTGDTVRLFVAPCLVSKKTVLGITDDVINAVSVYGDCVGGVTFRGRGAGRKATASAVVSDILEAHSGKYVKEYKNEKVSFLNVNEGKDMLYIPETDEFIQPDTLENQLKLTGDKKYYRVVEIAE